MQIAIGRFTRSRLLSLSLGAAAALPLVLALSGPAFALSDLQPATSGTPAATAPAVDATKPAGDAAAPADASKPAATAPAKSAEISFDVSKAPAPVQKMRQEIIDAATAGDVKKIAELMKASHTDLGPDNSGNDIESSLKDMSGDGDGLEILSIMLDVLSTGYAHVDAGTPNELYVWPYFTQKQLDKMTPAEKVDIMRLVTAGDYADMLEYGNYNFYRVGITPDGKWKLFLSGN